MFDSYHKWLGIPRGQRPPTHYQLLGVSPDEDDPEVIEEAAIRQAAHVRTYQSGPHAPECARLLNEIAQARATLLSPARRRVYDGGLRTPSTHLAAPVDPADTPFDPLGNLAGTGPPTGVSPGRTRQAPRGIRIRSLVVFVLLNVVSISLLVWFFFLRNGDKPKQAAQDVPGTEKQVAKAGGGAAPVVERPVVQPPQPVQMPPMPEPSKDDAKPAPPPVEKEPDAPNQGQPEPAPREPWKAERPRRTPVPPDAELARARDILQEKFQRLPREKPAQITTLARELFQLARETVDDRALKFAALQEVQKLAVQNGDVAEVLRAVTLRERRFDVDGLTQKADVLETILRRDSDTIRREVAESAVVLVGDAVDADNLGAARRLLTVASTAAKRARLGVLEKSLEARAQELEAWVKEVAEFEAARAALATRPEDAAAGLVVGRYLCWHKGNWREGLPCLARAQAPGLKELAEKDLGSPRDARGQVEVGEGWLNLAKTDTTAGKARLLRRAGDWFEKAATQGTGTTQVLAVKRLKELEGMALAALRVRAGSFDGRTGRAREILFREGGGTEESDAAVARGLRWLARHQDVRTGAWSLNRFHIHAGCSCSGPGRDNDVAGTALALLAFLGDGQTHLRGYYAANVDRGLKFLLAHQLRQKPAGYFGGEMYAHAMATIAVCEAYGLTHDEKLHRAARSALQLIANSQNKTGGWRYQPGSKDADTSVTGWQIVALKTGDLAGISIPPVIWKEAGRWLDSCMLDGGAAYGYQGTNRGGIANSAIGLVCRAYLGGDRYQEGFRSGVARLRGSPPSVSRSQYYNYYATQLMHHVGGDDWDFWNPQIRDFLVAAQEKGDPQLRHAAGSWDPAGDIHGHEGGRIMVTALALLNLEVYYRSVPLCWRGARTE
jgi:hypothetical protein